MDIKATASAHLIGPIFQSRPNDKKMADLLVGGKLYLRDTPPFDISDEIDWAANPYEDRNWQFVFHSLRWTEPLRRIAASGADEVYGQLYEKILKSWVADNILAPPKSSFAWYDMASGIRAGVFAAAISHFGKTDWLMEGLEAHGSKMSSPSFGAKVGNHALHVRIGLLIVGNLLNRREWVQQAKNDIERLFRESINHEGVDFEGGMQYQTSNYFWYKEAEAHLDVLDLGSSSFKETLAKMPVFLTNSVNTLGRPVQFGDSDPIKLTGIDSTELEYIRSFGKRGKKPTDIYSHYEGGYTFGRTNWSLEREKQGLFYSLRHGPASGTQPHADHDGGSITLTFKEHELLYESGRYRYDRHPMSKYLKSNKAHNSIVIEHEEYSTDKETYVVAHESDSEHDWTLVQREESNGSTWSRGVFHHRPSQLLVVLDRVVAVAKSRISQHWQLPLNLEVEHRPNNLSIHGVGGENLNVSWISNAEQSYTILEGRTEELLGWRSVKYAESFAAPVLKLSAEAKVLNAITVLAPATSRTETVNLTASKAPLTDSIHGLPLELLSNGTILPLRVSMNNSLIYCEIDTRTEIQ